MLACVLIDFCLGAPKASRLNSFNLHDLHSLPFPSAMRKSPNKLTLLQLDFAFIKNSLWMERKLMSFSAKLHCRCTTTVILSTMGCFHNRARGQTFQMTEVKSPWLMKNHEIPLEILEKLFFS